MVDIICACIYCFGMALIGAGIKEGLKSINIVLPTQVTVEKELAHRAGEFKYKVEATRWR